MGDESRDQEDPRPLSDRRLREEHSREEVEGHRAKARDQHRRWMEIMKNRYGKD